MKDYLDLWTEDEKTLWMDKGFTTSVGFITTEDGWGINKKYLATKYQWRLIHKLEELEPVMYTKEQLSKVAYEIERKVLKEFKQELKGFKLLDQTGSCEGDKLWNELIVDYFKYVLKGELLNMTYRIEAIMDEHYENQRRMPILPEAFLPDIIRSLAKLDSEVKEIAYVDLDEEDEE